MKFLKIKKKHFRKGKFSKNKVVFFKIGLQDFEQTVMATCIFYLGLSILKDKGRGYGNLFFFIRIIPLLFLGF
jgi:hypothetical protein